MEQKEMRDTFDNFVHQVVYSNRYLYHHPFLQMLESLQNHFTAYIKSGHIFYRARRYPMELVLQAAKSFYDTLDKSYDEKKDYFWGYNEDESMPPVEEDKLKNGRANPELIRYLYLASNSETAMVEVRPAIKSFVSIARIKAKEELKVLDFTWEGLTRKIIASDIKTFFWVEINSAFSKPSDGAVKDYIPAQRISSYIKELGYDGIVYESALNEAGKNFVIFDPEKCKAISSKIYQITDIKYKAKITVPDNGIEDLESHHHFTPSDQTSS